MACLCWCFQVRDPEDDVSANQNSFFPIGNIRNFFGKQYKAICNKEQIDDIATTSTAQVGGSVAPLNSDAESNNNSDSNITKTPPRVLHFKSNAATATFSSQNQADLREEENSQVIDMELAREGIEFEDLEVSEEDEDDCPVCLEEYIPENPKIVLQCSHDYHLSCIYEWMERSETCPICSRVNPAAFIFVYHVAA
ncbi:Zinc finger, RING-type [Corchorus olitorius]|uniref:RING-type E3 ubiquitin transferase n=1 Tax=Corchorus olitorius TaxID=93759 RepID=A0A1R3HNX2_9ROSI|nr:Zinc finger, RING-type [Corchorus olitorius]